MSHSRLVAATVTAVACLATWLFRDATLAQEKATRAPGTQLAQEKAGRSAPGTQWEYKIMFPADVAELAAAPAASDPDAAYTTEVEEKGLNKLGAENWELVDVTLIGANTYHYAFKRPKAPK